MVKKTDKTEDRIVAVEEAFSKTEQFIETNQRIILIVVGAIIVIVLGFFGFRRFYLAPKEKEAQGQMFMAEKYFEMDSINKALNGDGNYLGFLDIMDQYGITKAAGLAHYYAGICYLKKGDYENAIKFLKKFSANDEMVQPMATGAIGDCYMELKEPDKAVDYYLKAADQKKNELTTPMLLMKAGWVYEDQGKYDQALAVYKRIKNEYPRSEEGNEIDKYIGKMEGLIKNKQ
jgi:tetratricopeptide (TPR) repeat protein